MCILSSADIANLRVETNPRTDGFFFRLSSTIYLCTRYYIPAAFRVHWTRVGHGQPRYLQCIMRIAYWRLRITYDRDTRPSALDTGPLSSLRHCAVYY